MERFKLDTNNSARIQRLQHGGGRWLLPAPGQALPQALVGGRKGLRDALAAQRQAGGAKDRCRQAHAAQALGKTAGQDMDQALN